MKKYTLSILIPARNEMFLAKTIDDILKNSNEDITEIITVLDGQWADPGIPQHPRVNVIYVPESIGQRGATNLACKASKAKYVMKVDAHCSFDKDFDKKMIARMQDDWTMVPIMRNLWAFDWKCFKCGSRWYQGPTPTRCMTKNQEGKIVPNEKCDETFNFKRKIIWKGKERPQSTSYCFDAEPHFQYFREYCKRDEYKKSLKETNLTETMSLQGSCFMATREKYWELNLCDEKFGSWGNQGIEVACKTWLSGGRVVVNHDTWYAHMFRTQGGDFSFPYPQKGNDVQRTKKRVKNLFWNNKWSKQKYSLSWLVEKFWPVPGWTENDLKNIK